MDLPRNRDNFMKLTLLSQAFVLLAGGLEDPMAMLQTGTTLDHNRTTHGSVSMLQAGLAFDHNRTTHDKMLILQKGAAFDHNRTVRGTMTSMLQTGAVFDYNRTSHGTLESQNWTAAKQNVPANLSVLRLRANSTFLYIIIAFESLILFVTIGIPVAFWFVARTLGEIVRNAIQAFDRLVVGTDVEIETLHTDLCQGILSIEGLVVKNPLKGKYDSPYLLKAGRVHLDLDMQSLVCSFFRHFEVERVDFKDVEVIYEKAWKSSNVQELLDFFGKGDGSEKKEVSGRKKEKGTKKVTVHEVNVEDVGARLQAQMLGGRGMRVSVGDIKYKDFAEEVGEETLGPIIQVLMKSVLKTVVINIAGAKVGERML